MATEYLKFENFLENSDLSAPDWGDQLEALMEEEKWDEWEESILAQYKVYEEEPYTDSEEDYNLSDFSDERSDRHNETEDPLTLAQLAGFQGLTVSQLIVWAPDSRCEEIVGAYAEASIPPRLMPVEIYWMRSAIELTAIYRM